MTPPTTTYNRGDVLLVEITFSGSIGRKRRPAVVMSTGQFNLAGIKLIVAGVTSNVSPPFRPGDTLLDDWSAAGLVKLSAVRGIIVTVDRSEVVRLLGRLSQRDMAHVEQGIASILGFHVPGSGSP